MDVFGYGHALFLLLLVPLLAIVYRYAASRDARARETFSDPARHGPLGFVRDKKRTLVLPLLVVSAVALTSLAVARPLGAPGSAGDVEAGMDVVILLDVSASMGVPDEGAEARLDAAREFARALVYAKPANRYGLVVFAGDAVTACPLTLDHDAFINFVAQADPSMPGLPGSAIGEAIAAGATRFKKGELPRALLILSDGENTYGRDAADAAKAAKDAGMKVHAAGFGTAEGGKIPVGKDFFGEVEYKKDRKGQVVVSALDEAGLRKITGAGGGVYVCAAGDAGALVAALSESGGEKVADPFRGRKEYGPYFALGALLLLAAALII